IIEIWIRVVAAELVVVVAPLDDRLVTDVRVHNAGVAAGLVVVPLDDGLIAAEIGVIENRILVVAARLIVVAFDDRRIVVAAAARLELRSFGYLVFPGRRIAVAGLIGVEFRLIVRLFLAFVFVPVFPGGRGTEQGRRDRDAGQPEWNPRCASH